jgi:hypothetical protein
VIHLTAHQLSTYLDRELPESSTELVRRHLEGCAECSLRFGAFREQEAILDRVLTHDPGEDFFSGFADRVLGRGRSQPSALEPIETASPRPEPVAMAPEPERRMVAPAVAKGRRGRQPAIPWFAAAILCLIVGAIGYTIPRPSRIPNPVSAVERPAPRAALTQRSPVPEPPAETLAKPETPARPLETRAGMAGLPPRSPEAPSRSPDSPARASESPEHASVETAIVAPEPSVVPVRRFHTTTSVVPSPAPAMPQGRPGVDTSGARRLASPAPAAPPDEFAGAPPSAAPLLTVARRASQAAAADSSAANLDAAAEAWDQAVSALSGAQQTIARRHLAESRYRAWMAAPDAYRAASAIASLRAFLVLTPPSPERDLAKEQLRRIGG